VPMVTRLNEITGIGQANSQSLLGIILYGKPNVTNVQTGVQIGVQTTYQEVVDAVNMNIDYRFDLGKNTRTDLALLEALKQLLTLGRPNRKKCIIICTDGATFPAIHSATTKQYAQLAADYGIPVIVCTIPNAFLGTPEGSTTLNQMEEEIAHLSRFMPSRVYRPQDTSQLISTLISILDNIFFNNDPNRQLGVTDCVIPPTGCVCGNDGYEFVSDNCYRCNPPRPAGCFKIHYGSYSWEYAELICQSEGAHLASWNDDNCLDDIKSYIGSKGYVDNQYFWTCASEPAYFFSCDPTCLGYVPGPVEVGSSSSAFSSSDDTSSSDDSSSSGCNTDSSSSSSDSSSEESDGCGPFCYTLKSVYNVVGYK
ncbi:unnamed protein product, partial [Owenia fusiformis]